MYLNEGFLAGIIPLNPSGTNSTMFTECCGCAICDDEANCPVCKRKVVGWDEETKHGRRMVRWQNATKHWKRKAGVK